MNDHRTDLEPQLRPELQALRPDREDELVALTDLLSVTAAVCGAPAAALTLTGGPSWPVTAAVGSPTVEAAVLQPLCEATIASTDGALLIGDVQSWSGPTPSTAQLRSYAAVVISAVDGSPAGVLFIADSAVDAFAPRHIDRLRMLARQAASLIELHAANHRLWRLADHWSRLSTIDDLTAVANRRGSLSALEGAIARHDRYGLPSVVIMADVDRLKHVNDTYGHGAGDVLLRVTAGRLQHATRDSDVVGRWGGDEFVVVCSGAHSDLSAQRLLAKLSRATGRPLRFEDGHTDYVPSVSLGFARTEPGDDVERLLARADQQMFTHKRVRA